MAALHSESSSVTPPLTGFIAAQQTLPVTLLIPVGEITFHPCKEVNTDCTVASWNCQGLNPLFEPVNYVDSHSVDWSHLIAVFTTEIIFPFPEKIQLLCLVDPKKSL